MPLCSALARRVSVPCRFVAVRCWAVSPELPSLLLHHRRLGVADQPSFSLFRARTLSPSFVNPTVAPTILAVAFLFQAPVSHVQARPSVALALLSVQQA